MVTINAIDSLRQSLQKLNDVELKNELMGKVTEVQRHLASAHEHLHAQHSELESLKAQLVVGVENTAQPAVSFYDPPV